MRFASCSGPTATGLKRFGALGALRSCIGYSSGNDCAVSPFRPATERRYGGVALNQVHISRPAGYYGVANSGLARTPMCGLALRPTWIAAAVVALLEPEAEMSAPGTDREIWPSLPYERWRDTYVTLQLWTQIVGKIRLSLTPWLNHSWHVALYVTARGLTTSPIPLGGRVFQIDFDFIDHLLRLETSDGARRQLELRPRSVSDFYAAVISALEEMGIEVSIDQWPNEMPEHVRFSEDRAHAAYDPEYAHRLWKILVQADRVFKLFRTGFLGKCSPVHFFWGSFDLAVTRFSGRRAPLHPGGVPHLADAVVREAYSHEVSSAGFWPGAGPIAYPAFYSYAYPEPTGFPTATVRPDAAFYCPELREFILPYDAVRTAMSPDETLLTFLQSAYEVAADAGAWDRAALECEIGKVGVARAVA